MAFNRAIQYAFLTLFDPIFNLFAIFNAFKWIFIFYFNNIKPNFGHHIIQYNYIGWLVDTTLHCGIYYE